MNQEQLNQLALEIEQYRQECISQANEQNRSDWTSEQLDKMNDLLDQYDAGLKNVTALNRVEEMQVAHQRRAEEMQRSQGLNHQPTKGQGMRIGAGGTDTVYGQDGDMQEFINWVDTGLLRSGVFSPEYHLFLPDLKDPLNDKSPYNRSLTTATNSGADAVPGESVAPLLPALYHADPVRASGARVISTPTGVDYKIPIIRRPTANAAARSIPIVAEAADGAEWDPTFTNLTLGAHSYRGYLDVTRELMQDNGAGLMAELPGFIIQSIVSSRGYDHVRGDGSSKPSGIMNVNVPTSYTTVTRANTGPNWEEIFEFYMSMPGAYRPGSIIHASRPFIATMMGLVDADGTNNYNTVVFAPHIQGYGGGEGMAGWMFYDTPIIPNEYMETPAAGKTLMVMFNPNYYVIRDVRDVSILRDPYTAAVSDETRLLFVSRADGGFADPGNGAMTELVQKT